MELQLVFSQKYKFQWVKGEARSRKRSQIYKIKNRKIENFEITKRFLRSLRFQRYIVFTSGLPTRFG